MWGRGVKKKSRSFRMCLKLNDNQFKTSRYSYRSTYMNPIKNLQQIHKNKRERNTSIPLKKIIKSQGKKLKEEEKNRKELQSCIYDMSKLMKKNAQKETRRIKILFGRHIHTNIFMY